MLAETQANRFAVGWKAGRTENQVNFGQVLSALPESHLVVDGINSRRALAHLISLDQFAQTRTHLVRIEGERHARSHRIFLEPLPVPFECEMLGLKDAHRGEKSPAVEQAGLTRGKARFLDWHDMPIVENVAMDHESP